MDGPSVNIKSREAASEPFWLETSVLMSGNFTLERQLVALRHLLIRLWYLLKDLRQLHTNGLLGEACSSAVQDSLLSVYWPACNRVNFFGPSPWVDTGFLAPEFFMCVVPGF